MKKITKIAAAVAAIGLLTCGVVFADTVYSSSSDPLVTLSYVNSTLKSQIVEEVLKELSTTTAGTGTDASAVAFQVIELKKGETLMSAGSCEIILRSGIAEAIITNETNITNNIGLSDLTAGKEITNGQQLKTNDYILIPRADGRGALVTSDNAYFMVRGEYEIVK